MLEVCGAYIEDSLKGCCQGRSLRCEIECTGSSLRYGPWIMHASDGHKYGQPCCPAIMAGSRSALAWSSASPRWSAAPAGGHACQRTRSPAAPTPAATGPSPFRPDHRETTFGSDACHRPIVLCTLRQAWHPWQIGAKPACTRLSLPGWGQGMHMAAAEHAPAKDSQETPPDSSCWLPHSIQLARPKKAAAKPSPRPQNLRPEPGRRGLTTISALGRVRMDRTAAGWSCMSPSYRSWLKLGGRLAPSARSFRDPGWLLTYTGAPILRRIERTTPRLRGPAGGFLSRTGELVMYH